MIGGIINQENLDNKPGDLCGFDRETFKIQCLPLYSVLLALGEQTCFIYVHIIIEGFGC